MKNTIKNTIKNTSKNLIKLAFIEEEKTVEKNNTSIYENIKEEVLKNKKDYYNINSFIVINKKTNEKKLGNLKLYSNNKTSFYNTGLLEEYNNIDNSNKRLIHISELKELEKLYNSLYNELYNGQTTNDLFNIYKTYYKTSINDNGIKKTLKDYIEFEHSISYFINNIVDNKILTTTKKINKDFIINKYLEYLKHNSIDSIEENTTNGQYIKDNIEEYINNKYILEKLNNNGQLEEYKRLLEEEEEIKKDYVEIRQKIKNGLIDIDKKQAKKDYDNRLCNISNKIRRIKKQLKVDYYL